jgi:tetratricopeptide (TPR) repeat protein
MHVGLLPEAAAEFDVAVQLDPTNELARSRRGVVSLCQLRYAEALTVFRETPRKTSPSLWTYQVASALLRLGRRNEAEATLKEFRDDGEKDQGGVVASVEAMAAAVAGDAAAVERFAARAAEGKAFGHFHHTAYHLACAYALLGRPGEAMAWLRSAAESGYPCYPLFAKDPYLDRIRTSPDFVSFLERQRQAWEARRALLARAG